MKGIFSKASQNANGEAMSKSKVDSHNLTPLNKQQLGKLKGGTGNTSPNPSEGIIETDLGG
jgi:hypothetical protein